MAPSEWAVEDHLRDQPAAVVALYRRFVELVQACGPFAYAVSKTAITFKGSRRGFAGAKPKADSLDGYLDLQRRVEDPRIRRAAPYTKRLVVHQFRVTAPEQLDEEFAGWVRVSTVTGHGRHHPVGSLKKKRRTPRARRSADPRSRGHTTPPRHGGIEVGDLRENSLEGWRRAFGDEWTPTLDPAMRPIGSRRRGRGQRRVPRW